MMARTHALFGISSLWILLAIPDAITSANAALLASAAAFGSLLPDLDAAGATLQSFSIAGVRPFAPLSATLHQTFGHRGVLHSPAALVVLAALASPLGLRLGWQVPVALWLGYASHLAADACTRSGIPAYPFGRRLFLLPKRFRFLTGSSAEDMLLPFLAFAVLYLLLRYLFTLHP